MHSGRGSVTHDSRHHSKHNLGDDLWKHVYSTQEGRVIFDTLEEDGQIVIEAEKDAKEEEHVRGRRANNSRAEHGERQHGVVASIVLPDEKQDEREAGADEQADHDRIAPGVALTAPF